MSDILKRNFVPSSRVVESSVGEETILLNLSDSSYYGLDGVGTKVWTMLKSGTGLDRICRILSDEFGLPLHQVEKDVAEFLVSLDAHGIVVDA